MNREIIFDEKNKKIKVTNKYTITLDNKTIVVIPKNLITVKKNGTRISVEECINKIFALLVRAKLFKSETNKRNLIAKAKEIEHSCGILELKEFIENILGGEQHV